MNLLFDVAHALASLHPNSDWYINGDAEDYANLTWEDTNIPKPTEEEVTAERQRLTDEWNNAEYQRVRKELYPDIGEQLDMLWHAIDNGVLDKTSDFYTTLQAVKTNNPKPTE